jgi:hypothetical protein
LKCDNSEIRQIKRPVSGTKKKVCVGGRRSTTPLQRATLITGERHSLYQSFVSTALFNPIFLPPPTSHDPSRPFPGNGMKTIDFIPYIKQSGELIPLTQCLLVTLFPSVSLPLCFLRTPNGFSINFFLARTLIRFQTNLR